MEARSSSQINVGVRYSASILSRDGNDPRIKALRWVPRGSRVLEIGCGHGAVTRILRDELDCRVVALDLDPGCAPSVSGSAERFVCGDISEESVLESITGAYDCVLLMDVLEHMAAPDRVLAALARCVGPHAQFVITLPNFVVWHVRLPIMLGRFEYQETGTLDRTHLRFFSPTSARQLISDAGLRLESVEATWNVPALGNLWSFAQVVSAPNLEHKVERRFPRMAPLILGIVQAQRALNHLGWARLIGRLGEGVRAAAPSMFTNHVLLLAQADSTAGSSR